MNNNVTTKTTSLQLKHIFIGITFLLIGIIFNFPIKKIVNYVSGSILNKSNCHLTVFKSKVSFFPPGYIFSDLFIPASCSQGKISNLRIEQLKVVIKGPSFFPPGIRLQTKMNINKSRLMLNSLVTMGSIKLKIEKTLIDSKLINNLIAQNDLIFGQLFLKALVTLKNNFPSKGSFAIYSKNIGINSKTIMGFLVPSLNFGFAKLIGQIDSPNSINLSNLTIGNLKSPLVLHLRGTIDLNKHNMVYSKMNLKGEIKFSKSFINKMAILNLFLNGKKKSKGFYKLRISGSFANPRPKIL